MFLFYAGYFACNLMALSAALTVFNWYYIALFMGCEFLLYLGAMVGRGQLILAGQPPGAKSVSAVGHIVFYLAMCTCPMFQLRSDGGFLGGGFYFCMIVYKLLSSAAIVTSATSHFPMIDGTEVSVVADTIQTILITALSISIFGATLFLCYVESSNRWTFYSSRQTGPAHLKWCFDAHTLIDGAETMDQQKAMLMMGLHPSYFDKDKVKEWLLELESDVGILGEDDKKLPRGCGDFSGHSLDSFFTKIQKAIAYYNDTESLAEVEAHLDKVKKEVDEREVVGRMASLKSFSSIKGEEIERPSSPRDEEILLLKSVIAEAHSQSDEKDAKISRMEEEIAHLRHELTKHPT